MPVGVRFFALPVATLCVSLFGLPSDRAIGGEGSAAPTVATCTLAAKFQQRTTLAQLAEEKRFPPPLVPPGVMPKGKFERDDPTRNSIHADECCPDRGCCVQDDDHYRKHNGVVE